ncbi:serine/threonine protein kinase [Marinibactrum halimedae]|uniref:serine/threonine protein kinase n=1 Tax=Marinibactrum halimedae TaxID=1444977 RepID=UPI0039F67EBD
MDTHPYSALTPDCVLDAVESVGYLTDARILALNSYENRVYQVGIEDDNPVITKFYRPERWSDDQILEEHRFGEELSELEVPVVCATANEAGETLHRFDQFRFSVFRRYGGHAPELDNFDHLLVLGRLIGRLHSVGQRTTFTHRPTLDVESFAITSREYLLTQDFIPSSLREAYESLSQHLIEKMLPVFAQVDYQNIRLHGDCHPGNILWRDDSAHFVDLDDARNGPAVQDLWMLMSGDRAQQTAQLGEILEGYHQFCNFNPAELRLIEPLRTLRIMHYAAWLARRWDDPAFQRNFTWFNTERYWAEHILELREQMAALDEEPLSIFP